MLLAGNARALINAPNANVNIGYETSDPSVANEAHDPSSLMTSDANFYGSIIGSSVSVISDQNNGAGAYLHYDVKLKQLYQPTPTTPVQFTTPLTFSDPWKPPGGAGSTSSTNPPATQWRAVTWQEQLGAW
jgi:hypothetical protein